MIRRLYELVTGTPWTTTRSAAEEFGPTVATRYAAELVTLTDDELIRYDRRAVVEYARAVRLLRDAGMDEAEARWSLRTGERLVFGRCCDCGAEYPRGATAGVVGRCWTCWLAAMPADEEQQVTA